MTKQEEEYWAANNNEKEALAYHDTVTGDNLSADNDTVLAEQAKASEPQNAPKNEPKKNAPNK
jgi:hypothetical protein